MSKVINHPVAEALFGEAIQRGFPHCTLLNTAANQINLDQARIAALEARLVELGNKYVAARANVKDADERIAELEARFSHVAAPSINPKSNVCHKCGLPATDIIHVPESERSWFEKAIMAGYSGVPRCSTTNCNNFVESGENYCTDCLDSQSETPVDVVTIDKDRTLHIYGDQTVEISTDPAGKDPGCSIVYRRLPNGNIEIMGEQFTPANRTVKP